MWRLDDLSRFSRTTLAVGAAAVLVLLSGCSSSDDDGGGSATARRPVSDCGASGAGRGAARPRRPAGSPRSPESDAGSKDASGGTPVEQQQVISTGNVQLRSDDVGQAIFDVRKVVDVHGGTISEDDTETDKDGDALRSRMVLRIPTADFDDAMSELEQVADAGLVQARRPRT